MVTLSYSIINKKDEVKSMFSSAAMSNFNEEFNKAFSDIESKFNEFDRALNQMNGKHRTQHIAAQQSTNPSSSSSSSSCTLSLIRMVSNLLDYLRDVISDLTYEKSKQVELNKQLDIHRKLIDGLTTEIIMVKEQNQKILNDYVNQNAKIEAELDQIKV